MECGRGTELVKEDRGDSRGGSKVDGWWVGVDILVLSKMVIWFKGEIVIFKKMIFLGVPRPFWFAFRISRS